METSKWKPYWSALRTNVKKVVLRRSRGEECLPGQPDRPLLRPFNHLLTQPSFFPFHSDYLSRRASCSIYLLMFPLFNLFLSSKLDSYFRIEFYFSWDCFKWLKWLSPTSSPGIQRQKSVCWDSPNLLGMHHNQKQRDRDRQPDTLKEEGERQ